MFFLKNLDTGEMETLVTVNDDYGFLTLTLGDGTPVYRSEYNEHNSWDYLVILDALINTARRLWGDAPISCGFPRPGSQRYLA